MIKYTSAKAKIKQWYEDLVNQRGDIGDDDLHFIEIEKLEIEIETLEAVLAVLGEGNIE